MDDIDLHELLGAFKKNIPFIVVFTFFVCLVVVVYTAFFKAPKYQSSTTIVLASSNTTETINSQDITVNKNLVSTYSVIAKSRKVLDSVIKTLNLNYDYEELAKEVSVSEVDDTEVIKITVTDKNSSRAVSIANAISDVFIDEVSGIYNMTNVKILDVGIENTEPCNINYPKSILISLVLGLVVSLLLVFLVYSFDTTLKTPEQIESKINLPILGRMPAAESKKGK